MEERFQKNQENTRHYGGISNIKYTGLKKYEIDMQKISHGAKDYPVEDIAQSASHNENYPQYPPVGELLFCQDIDQGKNNDNQGQDGQ